VGQAGSWLSRSFSAQLGCSRRKVAIRRDGEDFVIAFQPDDIVVFRHAEASALRKACVVFRWEVVSDTVAEANNLASW
jgi:hypothetical protein